MNNKSFIVLVISVCPLYPTQHCGSLLWRQCIEIQRIPVFMTQAATEEKVPKTEKEIGDIEALKCCRQSMLLVCWKANE